VLFTWVPSLGRHILWQYSKSLVYLVSMLCLVWFLPEILMSRNIDPSALEVYEALFQYYPIFVLLCVVVIIIIMFREMRMFELKLGHFLTIRCERTAHLARLVTTLSKKAGLRKSPIFLLYSDDSRTNAFMLDSFFSDQYVGMMGNMDCLLDEQERTSVLAHEIAHLKHKDSVSILIKYAGSIVLEMGFWFFIALYWVTFLFTSEPSVYEYLTATLIMLGLRWIYGLLDLAHTRATEYLADSASMLLVDEKHRQALVSALYKISDYRKSLPHKFSWLEPFIPEFLRSHPLTKNRAKALDLAR
jgi:Zn-dependent protease with chaperone function